MRQFLLSAFGGISCLRRIGVAAAVMYVCQANFANALVIKNLAPSGNALTGVATDLLGSDDRLVDHHGPMSELNDGVVSQNLNADAFIINGDGQNSASGNGVDTFAPDFGSYNYDFAGVLFDHPQYGISSVRFQNYIANDGGWWGPSQSSTGGAPLAFADLATPQVQVTFDAGNTWATVPFLTSDYRPLYAGVVRGSGFPNATAGPIATITFPEQDGINGIRLIGEGAGPADGSGFVGITELEVYGVAPELTLEVNKVSGRVRLVNDSLSPISFDFYRIDSDGGSLDLTPSGWNSLDTPSLNPNGFPVGSGIGDGWERLANLSNKLVAESFLQGSSVLEPGEFVSLGSLYLGAAEDLSLRYRTPDGTIVDIVATYVGAPALTADFNHDDRVDAADHTIWQSAFGLNPDGDADRDGDTDGRDFLIWQREFGSTAGATLQTIPEPGTGLLSISLLGLQSAFRRGQLV